MYCNSKIAKATSKLLLMGISGMLLLHFYQISFTLNPITRQSWSLPVKNVLNCPFVRHHVGKSGLSACQTVS